MPAPPLHPPPTTPEGTCWSNESFLVQGKVMCIINCSGACQVAILTHIHDDGYIPCTHATSQYSRPTALCACTRHSNCTYECISKQLSLPRLPSASRRPPVGLRQPPISLPVYICTCTATISAADLTRENCDIRFLPTFACGSNVPIGGLAR